MRNTLTLLFLAFSSLVSAQTDTKTEKYISEAQMGFSYSLELNADSTFKLVFLKGKIVEQNGKKILQNDSKNDLSNFGLKITEQDVSDSSLILDLDYSALYYLDKIHVSTDKKGSFQNLSHYLSIENEGIESYDENYIYQIKLPKTKELYVMDYVENASVVFTYKIPDNVSKIKLSYYGDSYDNFSNLELKRDDYDTNVLVIDDGKYPLTFYKEGTFTQEDVFLKYNSKEIDQAFVPELPESTSTADIYGENHYKAPVFESFKEALKALKNKSKLLVVYYDPQDNTAQKDFDTYLKTIESNLSYYTKEEVEKFEIFYYYQLKNNEKKLIEKYNLTDFPVILVLSSDGEKLYHTVGNIIDNGYLFVQYYDSNSVFSQTDSKYKLDWAIQNNLNNPGGIQEIFTALMKIPTPYNYTETVIEDENNIATEEETDTYETIKDEKNLYQLKSDRNSIDKKWELLILSHEKDKQPDRTYVDLLKRELNSDGYTKKLFNQGKTSFGEFDKKAIEYLQKFSTELSQQPQDYSTEYYYESENIIISNYLYTVFKNSTSEKDKNAIIDYFKNLLEQKHYNFQDVNNFINLISTDESYRDKEYLPIVKKFAANNFTSDKNIFERLDALYTKAFENDIYLDWITFKTNHEYIFNNAAWDVAESRKSDWLQEGIKWSEMSLKLNPNSGYYLDTLAHLYYQNGEKEKAIETEIKAIANFNKDNDPEIYQDLKNTLEKMKNGTY